MESSSATTHPHVTRRPEPPMALESQRSATSASPLAELAIAECHPRHSSSPMMKTWQEIKKNYPDALLLFRCGDFYEIMCEDAPIAAKVLDITLTYRTTRNGDKRYEMCGFPFHALDVYLPKLVRAGHRVAICDSIEKPKEKKQVKRKVTELVTPVK